jgi:cyclic pyranopterin phosphate synthase
MAYSSSDNSNNSEQARLVDRFGRQVSYVRMSVTDRCDFRCVYCMDEEMTFVPRSEVLSLEEMELIARAFVELGVQKIRLTGGEPLVRSGIVQLCQSIAGISGLGELVMTTNGSQLVKLANDLKQAGVSRLNVSLDSLQEEKFRELTRTGELSKVLQGIDAALEAGFERIKLNAVILNGRNEDEVLPLIDYALHKGLDLSFIEEMPLGVISEHSRRETFVSSAQLREIISQRYTLSPSNSGNQTSGPSRYYSIAETSSGLERAYSSRIGFISPHSENFCADCNRVRVTAEGRLLLCLGNEHSADLKKVVRENPGNLEELKRAITLAMDLKPEKHHFDLDSEPQIVRFMNTTGG